MSSKGLWELDVLECGLDQFMSFFQVMFGLSGSCAKKNVCESVHTFLSPQVVQI